MTSMRRGLAAVFVLVALTFVQPAVSAATPSRPKQATNESAPALWLIVATGAATGLLSSIVGYVLLGLPFVKVRVRHDLRIDDDGARVESYIKVANVRGRPVTIDEVFILRRHAKGRPPMSRPGGWTFGVRLAEGESVKFTFDRKDYPNAVAVMFDSAGRIWPRRRWLRVRGNSLRAGGMVGWPWQRNGPTERQIRRAVERNS
jgi:hypothetical protein